MEGENRQQQGQQLPSILRCPRCWSMDTKFGYFNNCKTSQPRYFCKTCRRYWTHGGKLRSIPYGGGGAKKRRSSTSPSSSTSSHGEGAEILRVANSLPPAPPVIVGSRGVSTLHKENLVGDGFKLATQNPTRPQPTANNPFQLAFTQDNHLSQLWGFSNDLNPFIANLVGQGQSWSSLFDRLHHVHIPPNCGTSLWTPPLISSTPASTVTTTSWDNSGSVIGDTSSSSSIDCFVNLPGYGPFP